MNKINFINLAKLSTKDYEKVKDLPINIVYRYTLKLIRTYPSMTRDAVRESLILDYQDGKLLTDNKKIEEGVYQARGFLHHLMTYELIMRELGREDTNKFQYKVDLLPNHTGVSKSTDKPEKDFEYF